MKSFLAAVVVAVALSVGAVFVLAGMQEYVHDRFATSGVRLEPRGS